MEICMFYWRVGKSPVSQKGRDINLEMKDEVIELDGVMKKKGIQNNSEINMGAYYCVERMLALYGQ